ncbi:MAG: RNA polymerase sigma factor [Planctomycetota bacterium]
MPPPDTADTDLADPEDQPTPPVLSPTDSEIAGRVLAGDLAVFEVLMRRYNQRLFRIVRSIVGDDGEAEDVVQETYVRAFEHLGQFDGRAMFSTWLTKIAIHEALARRNRRQRMQVVDLSDPENSNMVSSAARHEAEDEASAKELGVILARAVDELPDDLRTVFAMRMIEGLNTDETAACLDLTAANVKVRLHRARTMLRERIDERIGVGVRQLYQFGGERCDRIVRAVLARLACQ